VKPIFRKKECKKKKKKTKKTAYVYLQYTHNNFFFNAMDRYKRIIYKGSAGMFGFHTKKKKHNVIAVEQTVLNISKILFSKSIRKLHIRIKSIIFSKAIRVAIKTLIEFGFIIKTYGLRYRRAFNGVRLRKRRRV
jgi:ribosomal protein S11